MVVKKKTGNQVEAYRLGDHSDKEQEMIKRGLIRLREDGTYEIFSQEAVNGIGECARAGDYFKIDNAGFPYPNSRDFFENDHRKIGKNLYEQIPKELLAWSREEGETEEIRFLKEHKGLNLTGHHMEAPLWGTILSAGFDALIIYYSIQRDEEGKIVDIDFNFLDRIEFERTYDVF